LLRSLHVVMQPRLRKLRDHPAALPAAFAVWDSRAVPASTDRLADCSPWLRFLFHRCPFQPPSVDLPERLWDHLPQE